MNGKLTKPMNHHIPVIVGVGEITQRTKQTTEALEPLILMEGALQAAERDAGSPLLAQLDSLDVIQEFSWPYPDAPTQLSERLNVQPRHTRYGPVGGETPVYFLHEAALRIRRGESKVAAVVGAEAQYAVTAAQKVGQALPWTPRDTRAKLVRGVDYLHPTAVRLGVASPATVYPFYENAMQHAWGQTPEQGQGESGRIWANYSAVAAGNEFAWSRDAFDASAIATPSSSNRLIAWPYTMKMVANPLVNQGAAILLTTLEHALESSIPPNQLIHIIGGAAADECEDYLHRDSYTHVPAQDAVLRRIMELAEDQKRFDVIELYSCFPIVPKLARRTLGLPEDATLTCTGGLSFFGAPLNNYMTHAAAAMVRSLRDRPSSRGLLYGQGGYFTKHHALILGSSAPAHGLPSEGYRVQEAANKKRASPPPLVMDYEGTARLETYTVLFQRNGSPLHGVAIARTPQGGRLLAKVSVEDELGISTLLDTQTNPIGQSGTVARADDGQPIWSFNA